MQVKKVSLRTCVVTREKLEKKDLIRVVINKEGNIFIDKTHKANGRGVYLKNDIEVFKIAKSKKILDRALKCEVDESIYDELINS